MPDDRPTVAIAGASGFVGRALCEALADDYQVIGLTRSATRVENQDPDASVSWRFCDLFSLLQVEQALEGVDYAVYLVHSMLPSARLTQGNFADLDLILADNFARGAERQGVRQILYVGGLLPDDDGHELSPHLASRLEVERALGATSVPLTTLRAGLIVGAGGSSFRLLLNLVRRLPAMILPTWTRSHTQPIARHDVVRALRMTIGHEPYFGRTFDIGGPDVMRYKDMLERTAAVLQKRRALLDIAAFSPKLSKLWVSVFGGTSRSLVDPLVESLRHDMVVRDNELQRRLAPEALPFEEAVRHALSGTRPSRAPSRTKVRRRTRAAVRKASRVRSIQRMPLPDDRDAHWVAREYMRWLPRFVGPVLRVDVDAEGVCRFFVRGLPRPLLELSYASHRSYDGRELFYITGGLLADVQNQPKPSGRLEFREILRSRCVLAAIHDFSPKLPWYVYNATQALAHVWVMHGFRRHLARLAGEDAPAYASLGTP